MSIKIYPTYADVSLRFFIPDEGETCAYEVETTKAGCLIPDVGDLVSFNGEDRAVFTVTSREFCYGEDLILVDIDLKQKEIDS